MPHASTIRRWTAAALLAATALLTALATRGDAAPKRDAGYFTNLPLVTQDGEMVALYDDLIKDRIVVFNFIYTDCNDLCSFTTARMAQIADWLGDRVGRDIFLYSISLDPANDTPEKLRAFAAGFGIDTDAGWTFLTGDPADIDVIRFKLGERGDTKYDHRSDMLIGNDRLDFWRRTSVMGSLKVATQNILQMDPDWRAPIAPDMLTETGDRPATDFIISDRRGEAMFVKVCAACHTIGSGVKFGPDLAGVTLRRNPDWLLRYLQAPDVMLRDGDPTAVALNARYPAVKMPFMGLTETDAADLIFYLGQQFDGLDSALITPTAASHDHANHDHAFHDHSDVPQTAPHDHGKHDH
ncbi:Cytochrome oxidase Cu insertion factor, SCO1/SenC/PrrC family [Loktanella atrilutea]|uniref:Cytochrome oxidase Cu insertion factor, SCO1/SenC/PrrC family n=1 Tax=Loktanella atrilutea TaxID=366533 RepID=A0A1M5FBD8_LOKAT|nr:SCO family protein [Loktanella atrilutea]SHF88913.1 Cytochrome oxidase Cu insertion factor, SCO1/SenC/PrrC family [Loktanella atrilutea]